MKKYLLINSFFSYFSENKNKGNFDIEDKKHK